MSFCKICNIPCPNEFSLQQHMKGAKHKKKAVELQQHANGAEGSLHCKLCDVKCSGSSTLQLHLKGKKHQQVVDALKKVEEYKRAHPQQLGGTNKEAANNNSISKQFDCKVCGISCSSKADFQIHIAGARHMINLADLRGKFRPKMDDAPNSSSNKPEQDICHPVNNKKQEEEEVKIAVHHDSSEDIITFKESVGGKSSSQKAAAESEEDIAEFLAGFDDLSLDEKTATVDDAASSLFLPRSVTNGVQKARGMSLFSSSALDKNSEGALFGHLFPAPESSEKVGEAVYLNTHEPFCFVTVGVQGAGKSHTSSCVLESCLVPFKPGNIVRLNAPMISMVLHYDQNTSSICEAAGLLSPNPSIKAHMNRFGHDVGAVPKEKAVILVSPAYYRQRKKFYGDYCTVKPLLFKWRSLTADHIKRIMRIENGDNQLYVASFLDLLRGYQRKAVVPEFSDFLNQVRKVCNANGQKGPLDQRIALLESVVAESEKNSALVEESLDLISCSRDGYHFIIADLTDPLLSKEEANGLFQVLTEQFRTLPTKGGKVLCLDEAHKYMTGDKADGLSEAIVNVARLMRHDGVRLVVSTQSPKALAPELLELVTVAVLHHFHSPDWWNYLNSKLPLHEDAFERILSLNSGEAVAFATSHDLSVENIEGSHCLPMRIRPRITEDLGSSRKNS